MTAIQICKTKQIEIVDHLLENLKKELNKFEEMLVPYSDLHIAILETYAVNTSKATENLLSGVKVLETLIEAEHLEKADKAEVPHAWGTGWPLGCTKCYTLATVADTDGCDNGASFKAYF